MATNKINQSGTGLSMNFLQAKRHLNMFHPFTILGLYGATWLENQYYSIGHSPTHLPNGDFPCCVCQTWLGPLLMVSP